MTTPDGQKRKSRAEIRATDFRSSIELLAALAKSLHSAGLPAHRLESLLTETAKHLGTSVHVFALPTGVMLSVGDETSPVTMLLRTEPGQVHLERLAQLMAIARGIIRGQLAAPEAKRRVDFVMRAKPRWGSIPTVLAYVLSAGSFSVFFGGAIPEIVSGIGVGLAVGLISVFMRGLRSNTRLFELLAAAAAAAIANTAYTLHSDLVEWIPLASGLIILLPGLALVDALDELAHGNLASGGARMAGVGVVLLVMAFGAVVGASLLTPAINIPSAETPPGAPLWWMVPALVAVSFGSMIRFRARWRDLMEALGGSTVALVAARWGTFEFGSFAGPFLAALLLGATANITANALRQPAQLITVPGLALLVPGSFGVRSLSSLLNEETALGVDTAFHMFLTAMALVCGLLVSNSFFREKLHD